MNKFTKEFLDNYIKIEQAINEVGEDVLKNLTREGQMIIVKKCMVGENNFNGYSESAIKFADAVKKFLKTK